MSEVKAKKSNKMKIAIISLAIAVVVAIGGMIGVYAASQQTVGAQFSVKYSIQDNVAVGVAAKTFNPTDMTKLEWFKVNNTTPTLENMYEIGVASSKNEELSLVGGDYTIDTVMPQVFIFYFENLTDLPMRVTFSDNSIIDEGIEVLYSYVEVNRDDELIGESTYVTLDENNSCYFDVPGETIYSLGMTVAVSTSANYNKSLRYISTASNGIGFDIQQAPTTTA